MKEQRLKNLINNAIEMDRNIRDAETVLKSIKTEIINEALSRPDEYTATEGGGFSWTAQGDEGSIARVTVPGPKLKARIDGEGKALAKIREVAGRYFDKLFRPAISYKPIEAFRAEAAVLMGTPAGKLIKLCESESSPSVSFETKEGEAA